MTHPHHRHKQRSSSCYKVLPQDMQFCLLIARALIHLVMKQVKSLWINHSDGF